ncbi:MAG: hypothetical protein KIC73_00665 [Clostridiales bacterium]|nr:hypothetical protein [Clostridiales bacterium]
MKNESIKIGNTTYKIANGSCSLNNLNEQIAKVAIIIGSNDLQDIHKNLSENSTVIKYDADGVEQWTQDNLVFTGQPIFNPSFPIGIEQIQETDEEGKPKYINKEIMDAVLIAEYRTPNLQDQVKAQAQEIKGLNAQVAYLQMLSGIETEVGHE